MSAAASSTTELIEKMSLSHDYDYNGCHEIDPEKVSNYLSQIKDEQYKKIVQFIIENTKYVTTNELLEKLSIMINQYLTNANEDFYIYLDHQFIGTEHYLVSRFYDIIKVSPFFKGFVSLDSDLHSGNVLFIDDAIYSGNQLCSILDFWFERMSEKGIRSNSCKMNNQHALYKRFYSDLRRNIRVHILIPFVSTYGKLRILSFLDSVVFHTTIEYIETITHLCCENNMMRDFHVFSDILHLENITDEEALIGLYFDHTVTNITRTFPQIYLYGQLEYGSDVINDDDTRIPKSDDVSKTGKTGSILKRLPDKLY